MAASCRSSVDKLGESEREGKNKYLSEWGEVIWGTVQYQQKKKNNIIYWEHISSGLIYMSSAYAQCLYCIADSQCWKETKYI